MSKIIIIKMIIMRIDKMRIYLKDNYSKELVQEMDVVQVYIQRNIDKRRSRNWINYNNRITFWKKRIINYRWDLDRNNYN